MSTSPEDRIVTAISRWLARHLDDEALAAEIRNAGDEGLSPAELQARGELLAELDDPDRQRGRLEMVARETLELLALGE